jgi:branched-chain amino acid aminotransferase
MSKLNEEYIVRINGEKLSPDNAYISVFDHGFLFGDSIYEAFRTVNDEIIAWTPHLQRLKNSAGRLSMNLHMSDQELYDEIKAAISDKDWGGESFIRIIITRGIGKLEISPESCLDPNLILFIKKLPQVKKSVYTDGVVMCLSTVRRNSRLAMDPGIKSGNYLNNVMALIEAKKLGADDAFMLNENEHITEATTSNIWFVRDGRFYTPTLDCGLLAGITRGLVLDLLKSDGKNVKEGKFTVDDISSADEIFTSSSIKGIAPVKSVRGEMQWDKKESTMVNYVMALYEKSVGIR